MSAVFSKAAVCLHMRMKKARARIENGRLCEITQNPNYVTEPRWHTKDQTGL